MHVVLKHVIQHKAEMQAYTTLQCCEEPEWRGKNKQEKNDCDEEEEEGLGIG